MFNPLLTSPLLLQPPEEISGPLTHCGACRAQVLFSATNASLNSAADDYHLGYVAAQRAAGDGLWTG